MRKQLLSIMLALCMALALLPTALAADSGSAGYSDSGSTTMTKLTQVEIAQLMETTKLSNPTQIYSTEPGLSAPYSAGTLRQDILQAGLDRLNALRRIAGLPAVSLDTSYTASTQAAALVNAVNDVMTHYPTQPSGMSDDLYKQGYNAAGRSNIAYYYGYNPVDGPIAFSVDMWMDDSDFYNIDALGHRRWQLNPTMGKTGFGAVYSPHGSLHSAEYSFDTSGSSVDYNFIAWPASGNFPAVDRVFNADTAWSVTLNPSKYQTPTLSAVSVTLKRQSDGKSWTFNGSENYYDGFYGKYFNVETSGYGVSNCIIFRPDEVDKYEGVYTVTIAGLRTRSGTAATLSYQVNFFDPKNPAPEPSEPTEPTQPSTPASGTAYPSTQMVDLDGKEVEFQMYALKDEKGNDTNYIKIRDLANALNGTAAQFNVDWVNKATSIETKKAYVPNGTENSTPFTGNRPYTVNLDPTNLDGVAIELASIRLNDDAGGGYTYCQVKDLAAKLDFNAYWDSARGIICIETDKPYAGN